MDGTELVPASERWIFDSFLMAAEKFTWSAYAKFREWVLSIEAEAADYFATHADFAQ